MQKKGGTEKAALNIQEVKEEAEQEPKFKLKKAALDMGHQAKWTPRVGPVHEDHDQEQPKKEYHTRMLRCMYCPYWIETASIKLRTSRGYRTIACQGCKRTNRTNANTCQCRSVWHHCDLHTVDPQNEQRKGGKAQATESKRSMADERPKELTRKVPRLGHCKEKRKRTLEDRGE